MVDRKATGEYLAHLARQIDPKTGKPYTEERLSEIFGISKRSVRKVKKEYGVYRFRPPEVHEIALPANERAFYVGLAFGNFKIDPVRWANREYIVVGTESKDPARRKLLENTIGTRGVTIQNKEGVRVYLSPQTFGFLCKPERLITADFLDTKGLYAAMLAGIIAVRLSDKKHHITIGNAQLTERIYGKFQRHFGFSLGNIRQREDKGIPVIIVRDLPRVEAALLSQRSVKQLPFLHSFEPTAVKPTNGRGGVVFDAATLSPARGR